MYRPCFSSQQGITCIQNHGPDYCNCKCLNGAVTDSLQSFGISGWNRNLKYWLFAIPSEQGQGLTTNSTDFWRQVQDSNLGHAMVKAHFKRRSSALPNIFAIRFDCSTMQKQDSHSDVGPESYQIQDLGKPRNTSPCNFPQNILVA